MKTFGVFEQIQNGQLSADEISDKANGRRQSRRHLDESDEEKGGNSGQVQQQEMLTED